MRNLLINPNFQATPRTMHFALTLPIKFNTHLGCVLFAHHFMHNRDNAYLRAKYKSHEFAIKECKIIHTIYMVYTYTHTHTRELMRIRYTYVYVYGVWPYIYIIYIAHAIKGCISAG